MSEANAEDLAGYFQLLSEQGSDVTNLRKLGLPVTLRDYEEKKTNLPTWLHILVALEGKEVIGASTLTGAQNLKLEDAAIIADLRVASGLRRSGVGSELMRATLDHAKAHGIVRAVAIVSEMNIAGVRLFQKFGFKAYGVLKDFYDEGENAINFERYLA